MKMGVNASQRWTSRLIIGLALMLSLTVRVSAQGWPPTPAAGDDPYTTGTFTSGSRTYKITYLSTGNSTDAVGPPGPATVKVIINRTGATGASVTVGESPSSVTLNASGTTSLFDVVLDPAAGTNPQYKVSTDAGRTSKLLRKVKLYGYIRSFNNDPNNTVDVEASVSVFYKFRIELIGGTPPASEFGVNVVVAQAGEAIAGIMAGPFAPPGTYRGNAGPFPRTVVAAYPGTTRDTALFTRTSDVIVPATLRDSVGYFFVNATPSIKEDIQRLTAEAEVHSKWVIVPLDVVGP